MSFQVNGITYLLTFHPGVERWLLLAPAESGMSPLPVYDDGAAAPGFSGRTN